MAGVLVAALFAAVGCFGSSPGGGTGKDDTFTLAPAGTATLKQGESQTVKIAVQRGAEFKQVVKLTAGKPPQGVKVDFTPAEVKVGDKEAEMKITAEKDAALGEQTVTVTGTPESGKPTSVPVKVKVEESKK
jgi:hypothetical protein